MHENPPRPLVEGGVIALCPMSEGMKSRNTIDICQLVFFCVRITIDIDSPVQVINTKGALHGQAHSQSVPPYSLFDV